MKGTTTAKVVLWTQSFELPQDEGFPTSSPSWGWGDLMWQGHSQGSEIHGPVYDAHFLANLSHLLGALPDDVCIWASCG